MADGLKLDLDTLVPQGAEVKVNGEWYAVTPPKMNQVIEIVKLLKDFAGLETLGNDPSVVGETVDGLMKRVKSVLGEVMPALKEKEDLDLTMQQVGGLLSFAFELSQNPAKAAVKEEHPEEAEKKH